MAETAVTAIVIAKNEERVIARCLQSLAWCNEVLLVDSGSTDRTVEIARESNATVLVNTEWQGPAAQRNYGIGAARGTWCLLLDADEWVTESLRCEIRNTLARSPLQAAFSIPRASSYCGQIMRHGGWWPDRVTRLVRKGAARFSGGIIHDHCVADGDVGRLAQPLMHESYRDLDQVLGKVNAYSSWGAQDLLRAGKTPSLTRALFSGWFAFFRTYVLRAGFLDGKHGLMLAISNAEHTYYKYAKAMLLVQQRKAAAE
ncbi:MAG: glycosyltransferase family 2 protein [Burkholderiaceae bacterium]|nr:glycosyltransferase family 2 protein [Burkholderiaceae bacterium]